MTCLIITNHESDLSGLSGDRCCDHNPELSHHDQPDGLSPYKALYTMENASDFLSANVSWISLGTHKKRLEEGLEGSWNPAFHWPSWRLAALWLVHTDHVTGILASDWSELSWLGNQDGHWLLPPVFILDPIFTRCRHIVIICSFMFLPQSPLPYLKLF